MAQRLDDQGVLGYVERRKEAQRLQQTEHDAVLEDTVAGYVRATIKTTQ